MFLEIEREKKEKEKIDKGYL